MDFVGNTEGFRKPQAKNLEVQKTDHQVKYLIDNGMNTASAAERKGQKTSCPQLEGTKPATQ